MIHEYAISPDLLMQWASNHRDYQEFLREYGLGTPRLISSYPKLKTTKCRSYYLAKAPANKQSQQARRYLEMVNHFIGSLVIRDGCTCISGDWNVDVIAENLRLPFYAVLSSTPIGTGRNLIPANMYTNESIWNHNRQRDVQRQYAILSAHLRNILRYSIKKIAIIDAYAWNERSTATIRHIIEDIFLNRVHSQTPELVIFYKERIDRNNAGNASPSAANVKTSILHGLSAPQNQISLKVYELKEVGGTDVFHRRCILSEHCGVSLDHGIDLSEDPNHTDELTLLEKDIYLKKWDQFIDNNRFKIVSESQP